MQVINLRTLKPIDRDTIVKSIRKTHRVVSAEEGWPQCGIGAELIAIATEECFDDLDSPPERVTGAEVPMPYAANLEAAALPQARFPLGYSQSCSCRGQGFVKHSSVCIEGSLKPAGAACHGMLQHCASCDAISNAHLG